MNGYRLFPVHILIKDLSFMMFYFIIMKYNLTKETYLPDTISNFPGASDVSLINIISMSFFYSFIPIVISFILYYPIVSFIKSLIDEKKIKLYITGFALTLITPLFHLIMSDFKHNDYYQSKAESIAWILCFVCSIGFYYFVNTKTKTK